MPDIEIEVAGAPARVAEPLHGALDATALRRLVGIAANAASRAERADALQDAERAVALFEDAVRRVDAALRPVLGQEAAARLAAVRPAERAAETLRVASALLEAIGCGDSILLGSMPPSAFRQPSGGGSGAGSSPSRAG